MTPKEKQTIEETRKSIDKLIECFAKHPGFSVEAFAKAKDSLEGLSETLDINLDILDALD